MKLQRKKKRQFLIIDQLYGIWVIKYNLQIEDAKEIFFVNKYPINKNMKIKNRK